MKRIIAAIVLACILVSTFCFYSFASDTSANYSNVMDDLKKDENFSVKDYPSDSQDYSLKVIQIAESVNDELFIYVYQPSDAAKELVATEIRMSVPKLGVDSEFKDYDLTLLSTNGVFDKYRVEGLSVDTSSTERTYDLTAIFRPFDENIDETTEAGQVVTSVACEVGQRWTASTVNGTVTYSLLESEVVTITDKYVGYINYPNGFNIFPEKTDSHFVAFSTDWDIDKLMEATVYYVKQPYVSNNVAGSVNTSPAGESEETYAELNYLDDGGNETDGWFTATKYTWNRIESVSDFLSNELNNGVVFTEEASKRFEELEWVLRFVETERTTIYGDSYSSTLFTEVSDVSIVRLKFETDGETYNLGVVDDKRTGSGESSGGVNVPPSSGCEDIDLSSIISLVLGILILWICIPLIGPIVSLIIEMIKLFVTLITSLIKFPIKFIKSFRNKK